MDNDRDFINSYEYIDLEGIKRDLWHFYEKTDERSILSEKIIDILKPQQKHSVIDIGCGEGNFVLKVHSRVKECVALDPDHERLNILRDRLEAGSNVRIVNEKFEDFSTRSKYDITLSCHTLSFFKKKKKIIEKMVEITKKIGRLVLVLHSKCGEQMQLLESMNKMVFKKDVKHLYAEGLHSYLKAKGYNVTMDSVETKARFSSLDELIRLSYFFFRMDLNRLSIQSKEKVKETIISRFSNIPLEISTVHGILVISLK